MSEIKDIGEPTISIRLGEEFRIPEVGKDPVVLVFGRNPDTEDPKYSNQKIPHETPVKVNDKSGINVPNLARRAFRLSLMPNGSVSIANLTEYPMQYYPEPSKKAVLQAYSRENDGHQQLFPPESDLRNLKVQIAPSSGNNIGLLLSILSISGGTVRSTLPTSLVIQKTN